MKTTLAVGVGMVGLTAALGLNSCGGGGGGGGPPPKACASAAVTAPLPAGPGDPLFASQWHLAGPQSVNADSVWSGSNFGDGVRIAIVDDGLEITHEDLIANVVSNASYDYEVPGVCSPTGGEHGTAVAGVAAARDNNGRGGRGAAPRASLVGYNLLAAKNDANEADAMTRDRVANAISSNSWGAPDDAGTLDAPAQTWYDAINLGLTEGRNGLGTLYVWAAGNGGRTVDNSNYDGQANYRGVIPVCAVGDNGIKADYSEEGANLLVCAPSKGTTGPGITTTDRTGTIGYSTTNYTSTFGGTSSAAPLAAGVIGLLLKARPDLRWRDVRLILAETARQTDVAGGNWVTFGTAPTYHFSHKYGFGVIDAQAAVARAVAWTILPAESPRFSANSLGPVAIPDAGGGAATSTISVGATGIGKIEFIDVVFTSAHTFFGDLRIRLRNDTTGSISELAYEHDCLDANRQPINCGAGYAAGWRFGSMRHLGEAASGNWSLIVEDMAPADVGSFTWSITFHGRP